MILFFYEKIATGIKYSLLLRYMWKIVIFQGLPKNFQVFQGQIL